MAQQPPAIAPPGSAAPIGLHFPPPATPTKPAGDGSDGNMADTVITPEETIVPGTIIAEIEEEVVVVEPAVCWEGSFELGLNGSAGNSDVFNFRVGADAV